jgi:hypothetical protein
MEQFGITKVLINYPHYQLKIMRKERKQIQVTGEVREVRVV